MKELDFNSCYRAVAARDARFDGGFSTVVTSTHVCCPADLPGATFSSTERWVPARRLRGGGRCRPLRAVPPELAR